MKNRNLTSSPGFTLLEILGVLAIIGLIAGIVAVGVNKGRKSAAITNVIGTAQSSPIVSGCTVWYARMKWHRRSGSKRLSVWATNAQAIPKTRG